ncbi:MAG: rod shape-determining protein MreC [Clostridia bacterium]|nr:rod shape-determining protein MreC [Clostridia bacterium]
MARNNDRHFSEGDGLDAKDLGAYIPEEDERLPAWAQQREEEAAPPQKADAEPADPELETPTEEAADAPAAEENAPAGDASAPDSDTRKEADEAWAREATRVEGGQYRRSGAAEDSGKTPAPGKKNAKKTGKKSGKKTNRKKKNTSQAEEKRSFIKLMVIILVCGAVFLMAAMMVMSSFIPNLAILTVPRRIITGLIAPVQNVFSDVTDSVVTYLRTLKIRGNIEYEYEQLLIKLDDMANDTAIMEELRRENESLRDLLDEQNANPQMNGLFAQVIGTVGNNYFSTLTLNVGTANGVTDYMAVVDNGGLVGVTYNTREHSCSVRCIIDSDCTVAGLVQSSRDQGSVKGTLGTNGEPMCRMYYLPDNSLPRPGDVVVTSGVGLEFPKGIPIGYIRESTRGMEDNKSYVVLEPVVDFQHLEYVTVYRYRPSYAENAQARASTSQSIALEPLETARPVPSFEMDGLSDFMFSATDAPKDTAGETAAPTASPAPGNTPAPTLTPDPNATPLPENLEYHVLDRSGATATPSPRPTFTPTPSPAPTSDAGAMTVEDD